MKAVISKPKRLSKKQKDFVRDFVRTGNGTKSALKNYNIKGKNSVGIASSIATENLTKPAVIQAIAIEELSLKQALHKQGVTPEKIAKKIDKLLESKMSQAIDRGLSHATKIYGVVDKLPDSPREGNTYNFIFSKEVQSEVKALEEKIKARIMYAKEN